MLRLWRRLLPCLLLTKRIIRAFRQWLYRLPNVLTPGQKRIRKRSIIEDLLNKQYQPAVVTGAYGDRSADDEFFWAASELYLATESLFTGNK